MGIQNERGHGVFAGQVPISNIDNNVLNSEATLISARLRSRRKSNNRDNENNEADDADDNNGGIDLNVGFAGFVLRFCADGSTYEAFIRTGLYETHGIEYVCLFSTKRKDYKERI